MRWERGFWEGRRKGERAADVALGLAPAEILEAALPTVVKVEAERKTDLAATAVAM